MGHATQQMLKILQYLHLRLHQTFNRCYFLILGNALMVQCINLRQDTHEGKLVA